MAVHFYKVFLGKCNSAALVGVATVSDRSDKIVKALNQLDISEKMGPLSGFRIPTPEYDSPPSYQVHPQPVCEALRGDCGVGVC
jgi:hypothetical protein